MPWKLIGRICSLGIPAIIGAIARAWRKRRDQKARLKRRNAAYDKEAKDIEDKPRCSNR